MSRLKQLQSSQAYFGIYLREVFQQNKPSFCSDELNAASLGPCNWFQDPKIKRLYLTRAKQFDKEGMKS